MAYMASDLVVLGLKLPGELQAALAPNALLVIDESNQHIGHAGAHPSGESHFRVRISSRDFAGKSLLKKHRMVKEGVAEELNARVHALAIEVL